MIALYNDNDSGNDCNRMVPIQLLSLLIRFVGCCEMLHVVVVKHFSIADQQGEVDHLFQNPPKV